jgi:hypothetical protein
MEEKYTLRLYGGTFARRAFKVLGENAKYFDDNGGDPEGNAWLPSVFLDETDSGVSACLEKKLGEMVQAKYWDSLDEWLRAGYSGTSNMQKEKFEEWLRKYPTKISDEWVIAQLNNYCDWAYYSGADVLVTAVIE